MANLYRITPVENYSVNSFYSIFEKLSGGFTRGWAVTETYKDGHAFIDARDYPEDIELGSGIVTDNVHVNLSTLVNCTFDFDPCFTEDEREEIKTKWETQKNEILTDDRWKVEETYVRILGPVLADPIH
jgi:hypothetical protein